MQYAWPPQDPTRLPNPRHFPTEGVSSDAAFVYGNSGFNPNLRPGNASIRARQNRTASADEVPQQTSDYRPTSISYPPQSIQENETGSLSSESRSSSPEPYLSDYDDENWGPMSRHEDDRARRTMRRGSEGWEIRPSQPWRYQMEDHFDGEPPDAARADRPMRCPWEEEGRYNLYDPDAEHEA